MARILYLEIGEKAREKASAIGIELPDSFVKDFSALFPREYIQSTTNLDVICGLVRRICANDIAYRKKSVITEARLHFYKTYKSFIEKDEFENFLTTMREEIKTMMNGGRIITPKQRAGLSPVRTRKYKPVTRNPSDMTIPVDGESPDIIPANQMTVEIPANATLEKTIKQIWAAKFTRVKNMFENNNETLRLALIELLNSKEVSDERRQFILDFETGVSFGSGMSSVFISIVGQLTDSRDTRGSE